MIGRISSIFILLITCITLQAQTTKTGVLVIGNTPEAVAASIQSARSGAKTIYLTQSSSVSALFSTEDLPFIKNIKNHYSQKERRRSKTKDSLIAIPVMLNQASSLIKGISDTVNNLTINNNTMVDEIKKDGKSWEIRLKGGQKIKADVVVDATENLSIATMLGIDSKKTMVITGNTINPFENKLYRSSVALGYQETGSFFTILNKAVK
jgi:predicted NAD/FAD-dependent oxidoreductase